MQSNEKLFGQIQLTAQKNISCKKNLFDNGQILQPKRTICNRCL